MAAATAVAAATEAASSGNTEPKHAIGHQCRQVYRKDAGRLHCSQQFQHRPPGTLLPTVIGVGAAAYLEVLRVVFLVDPDQLLAAQVVDAVLLRRAHADQTECALGLLGRQDVLPASSGLQVRNSMSQVRKGTQRGVDKRL